MRNLTLTLTVSLAIGAGACVKGNPDPGDDCMLPLEGGTIVPTGCTYTVTTRFSAEAPQPGEPVLGEDPAVFHVHLGIAGDPRTSIVVQWRTRDETTKASTVRFAAGANLTPAQLTQTAEGFHFAYDALIGRGMPRVHEAHLCGLVADTEYSYQVGGAMGATEAFSPVYTFRTAPDIVATPDAEVRFAFVGDSREGYDVWQEMIGQFTSRSPDLILFSGDAVTIGIEQREWEIFFDRAEPLFARVPVISAHGNHDLNAVHYYSQFAMPGLEENFGLDYGWAHLTVANDTPGPSENVEDEIKEAIRVDLEASASARWKLVMHHKPAWSASTNHGSDMVLQREWMPLFTQYAVDLVLNGHDHDYEITYPMVWDPAAVTGRVVAGPDLGTVFVVSGGAGATLYGNGTGFWTAYSESTHSAALISVRRDQMTLEAFRADGTPITAGYSEIK